MSSQLMEILRPEKGSPGPQEAQRFIEQHQDKPLNFYFTKNTYIWDPSSPVKISILGCGSNSMFDTSLLNSMLNHPSMKDCKSHDWKIVFEVFTSVIANNAQHKLTLLTNFFKPRLPLNKKLPDITAWLAQTMPFDLDERLSPGELFDAHFSDFPSEEIWRLFIDGEKQRKENGWLDYECREPGFMLGMMSGFSHLKEHISEPLSSALLLDLHAACCTGVSNLSNTVSTAKYRDNVEVEYGLGEENASVMGLIELSEEQARGGYSYKMKYFHLKDVFGIHATAQPMEEIQRSVEAIILHYHQAILKCKNKADRIHVIINLITSLERTHPFSDGNCRTICVFLLNRELIRHQLSPVILDDPNRFDGFSKLELFNEICKGMQVFNRVKQRDTSNLGIKTEKIYSIMQKDCKYNICTAVYDKLETVCPLHHPLNH
ncbi:MAG: Fic family protein [Gammaproteobacteria bacterium]|nr:Fic family protein [Gammaproteobacteria bacterium]